MAIKSIGSNLHNFLPGTSTSLYYIYTNDSLAISASPSHSHFHGLYIMQWFSSSECISQPHPIPWAVYPLPILLAIQYSSKAIPFPWAIYPLPILLAIQYLPRQSHFPRLYIHYRFS
jgi:hypothetical protein